ncbi:hypothetical protein RB653_003234 [Dictyostelium firmibasis]|uniref:Uncharacterized protein n=1 Tax=Dictyostelium firmibasis TaxID=79012 RepID=A0AAN7TYY2_9MYCE
MRLILVLLVLSAIVGLINSQYVLMEVFTYGHTNCSTNSDDSGHESSSSDSSDWGSLSSWSSSDSSLDLTDTESCPVTTASSGNIFKIDTCLLFEWSPTIFKSHDGKIARLTFDDSNEKCEGSPISTHLLTPSQCYGGCRQGFQIKSQFALAEDLFIPNNTVLGITYTGECNGDFKNSFVSINYRLLNMCSVGPGLASLVAIELSCNSTSTTSNLYRDENCTDLGIVIEDPDTDENYCRKNFNFITVCNN